MLSMIPSSKVRWGAKKHILKLAVFSRFYQNAIRWKGISHNKKGIAILNHLQG